MRILVLALGFFVSFSPLGYAATLRTSTTLVEPQVRIADLFDDSGEAASRILGPGPAPGGRIVVEAAQAVAIARQFGVAWRPSTNTERVVIDRPGRLMARDEILGVVRAALAGSGAPADGDLELPSFVAPLVAIGATPTTSVEQVDYDANTGRFTTTVAITCGTEPLQRMRLSGRMIEMADVLVAARRLPAGTVVAHDDLQRIRIRTSSQRGEVLRDEAQAIGMALRRVALPGQPLLLADLGRPIVVTKGAQVEMLLQAPGMSLAALGQALEPGSIGGHISVLNPASGAVVEAEVIASDQVRVAPGVPVRMAGRGASLQVSQR